MHRSLIIFVILFSFFFAYGQAENVRQLNAAELDNILNSNKITLIDVRTRGEFANGHLVDAGQLNYYSLDFRKKLLLLPKEQAVYLYCNTGYRSQRAAEILKKNGYEHVYNLEHGIMEWDLNELQLLSSQMPVLIK